MLKIWWLAGAALVGLSGCVTARQIERAESQVVLGAAYYREGQAELAIDTFSRAVKLNPRNWRAHSLLGLAYVSKGQAVLAEESFKAALRLAPEEAEIHNNYGTFLVAVGRTEEAMSHFEAALQDIDYRNPALIYSNLSGALLAVGRPEDALRAAQEAVRRSPMLCAGWHQIGKAAEQLKDTQEALDAYDALAKQCPSERLVALRKAGCLMLSGGQAAMGESLLEQVMREDRGGGEELASRRCLEGE
jgi:type IV pilus assembly protein PilF